MKRARHTYFPLAVIYGLDIGFHRIHADQRAGSAQSSSQQAASTRSSTQDYPEQERNTEAVPPLPEPLQAPARQVMPRQSSACHACLKLSVHGIRAQVRHEVR